MNCDDRAEGQLTRAADLLQTRTLRYPAIAIAIAIVPVSNREVPSPTGTESASAGGRGEPRA
jgi:hypothetical protein